jgi:hypothetical protein
LIDALMLRGHCTSGRSRSHGKGISCMRSLPCLVLMIGSFVAASGSGAGGDDLILNRDSQAAYVSPNLAPERSQPIPIPPSAWTGLTLLGGIVATTLIRRRRRNQP